MGKPQRVERYGKMVWEDTEMDTLRRGTCLCHRCGKFRPGEEGNCPIAERFFEICKEHGTAFILTRCDSWEQPPIKDANNHSGSMFLMIVCEQCKSALEREDSMHLKCPKCGLLKYWPEPVAYFPVDMEEKKDG